MVSYFFWLLASVLRPLAFFTDLYDELPSKPGTCEDVYEPNSRRPAGRSTADQRCRAAALPFGPSDGRGGPYHWKRRAGARPATDVVSRYQRQEK